MPRRLIFQDDRFIAFLDLNPSASTHLLIIPKEHMGSVKELNSSHLPMIEAMQELGHQLLKQQSYPISDHVLGFHVPPFTSVYHLHMHVIGGPFKNIFRRLKYPPFTAPWWISVSDLKRKLSNL